MVHRTAYCYVIQTNYYTVPFLNVDSKSAIQNVDFISSVEKNLHFDVMWVSSKRYVLIIYFITLIKCLKHRCAWMWHLSSDCLNWRHPWPLLFVHSRCKIFNSFSNNLVFKWRQFMHHTPLTFCVRFRSRHYCDYT